MLVFYGAQPPVSVHQLNLGGTCPHCGKGTTFKSVTNGVMEILFQRKVPKVVLCYACDLCHGEIPVRWKIQSWENNQSPNLSNPEELLRVREQFNFEHVPDVVKKEIEEALDCLSVNALHGFAAMCRRAVQATATNIGAENSTRVERQMKDALKTAGLDNEQEWADLVKAVVMTGHDGSHPHLPEVDVHRAKILLALLGDLTYELFTRPGRIKEAAARRQSAIDGMAT